MSRYELQALGTSDSVGDPALNMVAMVGGVGMLPRYTFGIPTNNAYSVFAEVKIPVRGSPAHLGTKANRAGHFEAANRVLLEEMAADSELAATMRSVDPYIEGKMLKPGGGVLAESPAGWTWHHGRSPGDMQLVPRYQHKPGSLWQRLFHPNNRGGFAEWGSNY